MTKEERLTLIKQRHEALMESDTLAFGEIPLSKREIVETVEEMEGFREHQRDRHSESEFLTSDEAKQ
jgi:hypothetical protein